MKRRTISTRSTLSKQVFVWNTPLAMVTMSGFTPCISKPQKCSPVLPKPVWTSSETQTPPRAWTLSKAPFNQPLGNCIAPLMPCRYTNHMMHYKLHRLCSQNNEGNFTCMLSAKNGPILFFGVQKVSASSSSSRYFSEASQWPGLQSQCLSAWTGESRHAFPPHGPLYGSGFLICKKALL